MYRGQKSIRPSQKLKIVLRAHCVNLTRHVLLLRTTEILCHSRQCFGIHNRPFKNLCSSVMSFFMSLRIIISHEVLNKF